MNVRRNTKCAKFADVVTERSNESNQDSSAELLARAAQPFRRAGTIDYSAQIVPPTARENSRKGSNSEE